MLAVSDALSQDDYMPSGPFGLNKSLGSYKSMSDVGQAGGMKVFGYDDAFGGSGKQAAFKIHSIFCVIINGRMMRKTLISNRSQTRSQWATTRDHLRSILQISKAGISMQITPRCLRSTAKR